MEVPHTADGAHDPTRSVTPRPVVLEGAPDASSETMSAEGALRERIRLAALGADVGVALTRGETLSDMLRRCAEALVHHLDAAFARVWTLNRMENVLELQ